MTALEKNNVLIGKWNDILKYFHVQESNRVQNVHYYDFYEFAYPNDNSKIIRLRIEVDLDNPFYDVYYGIFLSLPQSDKKMAVDINKEWDKIRIYIDKERTNSSSRSYDCSNNYDIDPLDSTRNVFWPYWIKVGERKTELVAKDIEAIRDAVVKIGFNIVSIAP